MKVYPVAILFPLFLLAMLILSSCQPKPGINQTSATPPAVTPIETPRPTPEPTSAFPNLQSELLDERNKKATAPIGSFDFKNYTYELPRGWQNPDGSTGITLTNGRVAPVGGFVSDDLDDESRAEAKAQRRIGMSLVTTKYLDVTGDGQDEALVVLKIETGGGAIPQIVYVFTWNNGKPELLWPFRTGDRADGGLKALRSENGELVIELYGQDRFILGQTETGKITGDEEQLCCPTYFTQSFYKWNGKNFLMQRKRLTYLIADPAAGPQENLGEKVNAPAKGKR